LFCLVGFFVFIFVGFIALFGLFSDFSLFFLQKKISQLASSTSGCFHTAMWCAPLP